MKILKKFKEKQNNYQSVRTPTIAFFGDSVTHGCFEIYSRYGKIETVVETESGYHEKIRIIFNNLYPDVPVNIINAGISGDNAHNAKNRLERDVISYNPDIVIVCFGLNDATQGDYGLKRYEESLSEIFSKIKEFGADVIFLTPNLVTDKIEKKYNDVVLDDAVKSVIENGKENWLDKYLEVAKEVAFKQKVVICDCNSIWKKLIENGVNVNDLLSNRVNHPTRDMHWLFAYELVKTMFYE